MQLRFLFTFLVPLTLVAQAQQVSVTDYLGREVVLESPATRVVSLMPSHTETLLALGAADVLAGVDEASPLGEGMDLPRLGNGFQPNLELIVTLEPDLVLVDRFTGLHGTLEELGFTTFAGTPETLVEVLEFYAVLGELIGREAEATHLLASHQAHSDMIRGLSEGLSPVTVYVELDPTPFSAGPGSYIDDLLQVAGGQNIVGPELGAWPMLSNEFVVTSDPALVLLLDAPFGESEESFRSRAGFGMLAGRVVEADLRASDLLSRPGPGLVESLNLLFSWLHPGVSVD